MFLKQKVKYILFLMMSTTLLIIITGCTNPILPKADQKQQELQNQLTEENQDGGNEIQKVIEIDRTQDFDGDMAVVTKTQNSVATHYVINQDFQVLYEYKGNSTYTDGYMQIEDEDNKKTDIVDKNGNVVFSYGDYEYEKVELVSDGFIVTTKKTDTYQSSVTETGVYDLAEQTYLIEPNEEYVNKIRQYGDSMLLLNDEYTKFFNTKTKTIVNYSERVGEEFKDGYSVKDDNDNYDIWYLKVFDDKGNVKRIKSPYPEEEIIYGNDHQNGMNFEVTSYVYRDEVTGNERIRTWCSIYNLETGTAKDFSNEFWMVTNKPQYTKDGYALVAFNNQGGTPYYTVIDKEGNMLFEPQKVNSNSTFEADDNGEPRKIITENLSEGNYFVVKDDGVYKVVDKDNNVVVTAEENESFDGVTNNAVKVHWVKKGYYDQYYYKTLTGEKIQIVKEK